MKQVDKKSYTFTRYSGEDRWVSYQAQLREVLATRPQSVLEIGVGEGVVGDYLRRNTDIRYASLDVADDLRPDSVGDVRALPFPAQAFDTACAFEVLEHLPFEDFEKALSELARVAKHAVVVSLPHFGPPIKLLLKLPFLPEFRLAFKIPYARRHRFDGQHHWEIGKRGYPVHRIREKILRHFAIRKEFVPFGNQYHHFFVLEPLSRTPGEPILDHA